MIESIEKRTTFNDYLAYLRESIQNLADYWKQIGHNNPYIEDIAEGLNHRDPFIIYKASIAATLLLEDRSIYH